MPLSWLFAIENYLVFSRISSYQVYLLFHIPVVTLTQVETLLRLAIWRVLYNDPDGASVAKEVNAPNASAP